MDASVIILGAGLSGLYAAHLLERHGVDALIVEARERVGGRVLGVATDGVGHRVDLGPSWIWPALNPRASALAEHLGLRLFAQHTAGGSVFEPPYGTPQRSSHTWATEPPSMRVSGGMSALVETLRTSLQRTPVRPGDAAVALERTGDAVAVALASGARLRTGAVISTLPPRLLAERIALTPAPDAAWLAARRATPTWMAGQAKLVATYDTAFWRGAGLSGAAMSQRGPLVEIHDACDADGGHAALFGFLGLPAKARRQLGRRAVIDASVAQLARLFGAAAAAPRSVHLQDWADEPATATAADASPATGHPDDRPPELPAPWQGRLWLAGSECAPIFAGYIEGALAAAESSVDSLLSAAH